jgi:hypothetical protein
MLYGAELVTASRRFPSSKTCSACGRISEELPLSRGVWTCESDAFHDRDINAARNLRCSALDRASCARINACGEEGSDAGLTTRVKPASLKQESARSYLGMEGATARPFPGSLVPKEEPNRKIRKTAENLVCDDPRHAAKIKALRDFQPNDVENEKNHGHREEPRGILP